MKLKFYKPPKKTAGSPTALTNKIINYLHDYAIAKGETGLPVYDRQCYTKMKLVVNDLIRSNTYYKRGLKSSTK